MNHSLHKNTVYHVISNMSFRYNICMAMAA